MMTEEQIDRYEAFRRSSLQKASMRKVIFSLRTSMMPCQHSRPGSVRHKHSCTLSQVLLEVLREHVHQSVLQNVTPYLHVCPMRAPSHI